MVLTGREDAESLLNEKMKGKNKMDYKVTHTPSAFLFSLTLILRSHSWMLCSA